MFPYLNTEVYVSQTPILLQISLLAGASDRLQGGRLQNVSRIVIHPEYNPATFDNDVAVLRVKIPLIGLNIRSILIVPEGYEPYHGVRSLVTGWGRTVIKVNLTTPPEIQLTVANVFIVVD